MTDVIILFPFVSRVGLSPVDPRSVRVRVRVPPPRLRRTLRRAARARPREGFHVLSRVFLARALAQNADLYLLDEPFAGVDPISISDIKDIITQLKARDIGVLITDHNVRETLDICERAYIVGEGHVIASGTPSEVLANEKVRSTYLGEHFSL